ncbi:AAA family ATPase [Dolichospermum sp. ST_sed1]|nr:AAA family ATPase [Dolichospermum sp. ST_sed1]MDD1425269.1 AAA family ATPase [Dolichospermum sp. ST_sed9]MDD1430479.1 AAA family ATPase [Dolichospermum sp. ST_sed6]MDD1439172.1 AAA family ATPase [Dolichospermum sp. ST_sed3]MDD1445241.1 AAA family ATPase [Dolichospermum sp. ST_sed8]MDD1455092.1 AAA family ATPase [Dolichospermum sp. ST_sed7]MDD1459688.1 AAA family ATPase [Dolichospermum sp. ST_sed2]MDD1463967.1 AAA family ATPase [Dolichospermum sp. ST_sed5]MDD1470411.1 AAA family ATPase [D
MSTFNEQKSVSLPMTTPEKMVNPSMTTPEKTVNLPVTTLEKTVHPSMTTLTFKSESGNKNFSDGLAKLWLTDDLTGILHLGMLYEIHSYQESEIAPGLNYFVSDPKTPEWMIKYIAWQRPEDCFVHSLSQPVEIFISEVVSARELGLQILDAQSFKEWATRKDSENLTVKEALQIAKVALTRLSGIELQAELTTLRVRCNENPYHWNKLMTQLESEFNQELERRGIAANPTDEAEILKLEIKRLNAEKDEAKKALMAKDLRKKGIGNREIDSISRQLDLNSTVAKPQRFKPSELLEYIPEGLQWLFAGLLPSAGITLLSGDPAAGKSTLAYDCAASIVSGEMFLGEQPSKIGKVLFVVGDEPLPFAQDKLISRGLYGYMGSWELIHNWDVSQMEILEEALEDMRPTLVIFDSLTSINKLSQIEEKDSKTARLIYSLNNLLERYGSAGLMIHHNNKDKDNKGVNKIRGSSAIAAAASGIWLLEGQGDVRKFSTPKLRGSITVTLDVSLDRESGKMIVINPDRQVEDARPVIQRVKALFECAGYDTRLEFAEIQHQVGGTKDSLYTALSRLSGQGVLLKSPSKSDPRKKVYRLSPSYVIHTPPLPIVSQRLSDIMAETLAIQGLDISDKMPDKMPDISDKIPDNQSNLDVCHVSETIDNQESQPLCLTDSYFQEGRGVNDSVRQVENITQSEDTTIGVEPESIKVGDKVFVLHPQANENGDTVHEIGDGWVTVDFLTKQFPIGEVVKM